LDDDRKSAARAAICAHPRRFDKKEQTPLPTRI